MENSNIENTKANSQAQELEQALDTTRNQQENHKTMEGDTMTSQMTKEKAKTQTLMIMTKNLDEADEEVAVIPHMIGTGSMTHGSMTS